MTEPDLLENDPTRVLMRQIFGAIAQYEKAMIVEKLRAARQRVKAKRGRCEGRKPYGETDAKKAVIERTQQMRARGMSYRAIAGALTADGVPARLAQRWHTTQEEALSAENVVYPQAMPQNSVYDIVRRTRRAIAGWPPSSASMGVLQCGDRTSSSVEDS